MPRELLSFIDPDFQPTTFQLKQKGSFNNHRFRITTRTAAQCSGVGDICGVAAVGS
jgi:hypothetical protein